MPNGDLLSLLEGLIPTVFFLVGDLLERYRRSQGRVLTYAVDVMPVFRARQDFGNRIEVKYGDVAVDSLCSCIVLVRNRGSVALSDQPVVIALKDTVSVLEERFVTTPELESREPKLDEESSSEWKRRYEVELMNPGDGVLVDLTVTGSLAVSDVIVTARGGGLKCLPESSYALRERNYRFLGHAVWVLLAVGLPISLVFGAPLILWNGLVAALIGNRFEYYWNRWRSPRRRLSYQITAPRPVYTIADRYCGKASVEYMGRTVKNLYTCRVVLRNTGNRSLRNQNVLVWLKGTNILESSIHTEPELGFEPIRPDDDLGQDRRRYLFPELEPKDEVTIDLTFEGMVSLEDMGVGARGEMLKVEPEWEGWKVVSLVATAENVTWLLAGLVSLLAALLFALPFGTGGMDPLREVGYLVWQWFVGVSGEPGFFSGLFIGIAGFALAAFIVFRVNTWWKEVTAPLKENGAWATTGKPAIQDLRRSFLTFTLGILVFVCVVSLLAEIVWPGALLQVLRALVP
jgi:hypothetical protein